MPSRLVAVDLDAHDPAVVAGFWGSVLHRPSEQLAGGVLLPGEDTQVGVRFVPSTSV
jgi:hypothetical protein